MSNKILLGSTFPLTLIRRHVEIFPVAIDELRHILKESETHSFWGHENTVEVANRLLGIDVRPKQSRPAVVLDGEGYPTLGGCIFRECWVLSPEYEPGFRPVIGQEVASESVKGWQVLRIIWNG
jgi:hypothetical protein